MDRISQLPEPILHDIFLLLPWEDAARMSLQSKTYRDLWLTFPVYAFNFEQRICPLSLGLERKLKLEKETEAFVNYVDKGLVNIQSGKAIVEKFRLCMFITDPKLKSCIDCWMDLVVRTCIRELEIEIRHGIEKVWYRLPPTILMARPLEVLRLSGCKLEQPLFVGGRKCFSFRKLYLSEVQVDDETLCNFMCLCLYLEDFTISRCQGFENLLIPSLPKLERLKVAYPELQSDHVIKRIDIEAVNLQSSYYKTLTRPGELSVLDIGIAACINLKEMNIKGAHISDDLLEGLLSKFSVLQNLFLIQCSGIGRVKILHSSLQKLFLCLQSGLMQLEIEAPSLLSFKYDADKLPDVFAINASSLKESFLRLNPKEDVDTFWFLTLRRYLSNFNQTNLLSFNVEAISSSLLETTFDFDTMERHGIPQLPVVEHLKLERVGSRLSCEALLNGFLASCQPRVLSVESGLKCNNKLLKFLCMTLGYRIEDSLCCNHSRIKCWRHYLKDVIIEPPVVMEDTNAFLNSSRNRSRGSDVRFELKW